MRRGEGEKMTTKQYLDQIRVLDTKINHRIKQAEEIRAKAFLISAVDTTKDRVQTSPSSDAGLRFIDKYVDKMREIDAMIDSYVDLKNQIITQIESLDDERYMRVLYYRYIDYLLFTEIAERMNYSKDYVFRLHRKALREFEKRTVNVYWIFYF